MAAIKTKIELQDRMSAVLAKINQNLGSMMVGMSNAQEGVEQGFDPSQVNDFRQNLDNVGSAVKELDNIMKGMGNNDPFEQLTQSSLVFGNVLGNIISDAGRLAVNAVKDTITSSFDAYKDYMNANTQLASVLQLTSDNASGAFDNITKKANEIQSNGMFSSGAMMAAAGEFATYFSDDNAITSIMDTLTNYAAGMSQGKAVDQKAMVDYATNLAKMTTGAYDAMTKKGFQVTDAQKQILETGTDMEKVAAINDIIAESWGNMYEAMSQTPEGKIAQLANAFEELKASLGAGIWQGLTPIIDIINANWSTVQSAMYGLGVVIEYVMKGLAMLLEGVLVVANAIIENIDWIAPAILGLLGAIVVKNLLIMATNPITWIVAGVVALISLIAILLNTILEATGSTMSAFGVVLGGLNVIKTVFTNLIADAQFMFWGLAETITNVVAFIADKLNMLPGINIDVEGLEARAQSFAEKKQAALSSRTDYKTAFEQGVAVGDSFMANLKNATDPNSEYNPLNDQNSVFNQLLGKTTENTGETAEALGKDSSEELEYLRDLAEQETINRFTTAEIKVDMGGISQNISRDTDADSVIDRLVKGLNESMTNVAEGVYA